MSFIKFLESFWAEIILFVSAIGSIISYIIKARYNFKIKKQEIKFTRLHQKRGAKIDEIFRSLVNMESAIEHFLQEYNKTQSLKKEQALFEFAREATRKFSNLFHLNELYFDQEINDLLKEIDSQCSDALSDVFIVFEDDERSKEQWEEKGNQTLKQLKEKIQPAKKELKKRFQTIIGI